MDSRGRAGGDRDSGERLPDYEKYEPVCAALLCVGWVVCGLGLMFGRGVRWWRRLKEKVALLDCGMENYSMKMTWWRKHRLFPALPNAEYFAGMMMGIGNGIVIAEGILLEHPRPFVSMLALFCITAGVIWLQCIRWARGAG